MRFDTARSLLGSARRVAGWSAAVALAVLAAALAGTGHAAPAGAHPSGRSAAGDTGAVQAVAGSAPMLPLFGRTTDGHLRVYEPKATGGGLQSAVDLGTGYSAASALFRLPTSRNGAGQDLYIRLHNSLYYTEERGTATKLIGGGWDMYNLLVGVGDMGGTAQPDLLARDSAGALWLYQGKPDGTFVTRVQAGASGWNGMNALTGFGDYTGDGKADLLARSSTTGALSIWPGTGNLTAGKLFGAPITVSTGWSGYKLLASTGDNDGDGKPDLIASDSAGALWLFKGTGNPAAPFAARVQIGTSGWGIFSTLF